MNFHVAVSSETNENTDETGGDGGITIEVEPQNTEEKQEEEPKPAAETEPMDVMIDVKDVDSKSVDASEAEAANVAAAAEENKENTLTPALFDEFPPTPTSVKPVMEFTSEDTVNMDTSGERKEDDISLIVHVDETLNEFDDLVSNASCASLSTIGQGEKSSDKEKTSDTPADATTPAASDADTSKDESQQKSEEAENKAGASVDSGNKSDGGDATSKTKSTDKDATSTSTSKETRLVSVHPV